MAVLAHDDEPLARQAIQKQPGSAAAYFWLAEIIVGERPQEAIRVYRQGLELDPTDGVRWKALGDLLVERDPNGAIEAYLQSCINGDPGANGCWGAGGTAEQQGDIAAAISYYRLSNWEVALQRADELEQLYGVGSGQ
jgi:tetratricopeptide (TPR) repeat protein